LQQEQRATVNGFLIKQRACVCMPDGMISISRKADFRTSEEGESQEKESD
jgi:hypothetical protein